MERKSISLKGNPIAAATSERLLLDNYLSNYQLYEIPKWQNVLSLQVGEGLDVELELFNQHYQLELSANDIRSDDFKSYINGKSAEQRSPCQTFKGHIKGTKNAVRLSITQHGISGFIQLEQQQLFMEKSSKFKLAGSTPNIFVAYYQNDVLDKGEGYCGVTTEQERQFLQTLPDTSDLQARSGDCKFLKIATDADYAYYQLYGSGANAEILGIINLIEPLYVDTFGVTPRVTFQNVWTTADPYTGDPSTDPGSELLVGQLRTYWQTNFTAVVRDVVHLFTGVGSGTGGVVGRVYDLGTICSAPADSYGFTKDRFQDFLTTAHEIGHNFSGVHSDGINCGTSSASIMCQGTKQIPMYFSPASITRISNFIASNSGCLNPNLLYRILGSPLICSSDVYTLSNLLPTDTTVWSITPSDGATVSGSGNSRTLTKLSTYDGPLLLLVEITTTCGTVTVSTSLTMGTPSPYVGGTFNDGGSGVNQPLESTFNEVYHRRVYITLSGAASEFTWSGFYTNGNTTWYHPVGNDGLIIDFGDPLPVYPGDYIGFSILRTNACGMKNEPLFFYYNGPTIYFRIVNNLQESTFTVINISPEQHSQLDKDPGTTVDLVKLQLLDKTGTTVLEKRYPQHIDSETVEVSHLEPGTYLLRLFAKDHVETYQIVV